MGRKSPVVRFGEMGRKSPVVRFGEMGSLQRLSSNALVNRINDGQNEKTYSKCSIALRECPEKVPLSASARWAEKVPLSASARWAEKVPLSASARWAEKVPLSASARWAEKEKLWKKNQKKIYFSYVLFLF
uniref:Uncharacterized protein n=1 Tax=Meloidogyne incognita TaxID=6306 RepID=A0A914KXT4_MELIC